MKGTTTQKSKMKRKVHEKKNVIMECSCSWQPWLVCLLLHIYGLQAVFLQEFTQVPPPSPVLSIGENACLQ